ncbi:MAG: fumarylacetoacetate hydrolase family protein [Chloroflexi bacterium]|nr:fumarylacetoacetate hydrolase family protein [Chloroflexota bacterium]
MKYVTYRRGSEERLGAVVGSRVVDLAEASSGRLPANMLAFLDAGEAAWSLAKEVAGRPGEPSVPLADTPLAAPIPHPRRNIFALGLNYRDHIAEGAKARGEEVKMPPFPVYFTKAPSCVVGPDEPVLIEPEVSDKVDWEVELTVVIGKPGRNIPEDRAWEHVFGYTCGQDVSARDLQRRHGQWFKGKSLDTFAPIGPWIVDREEAGDPHTMRVVTRVNGVVKQDSNTSYFLFDIPVMISALSRGFNLEPGDLIMTGTPQGVGYARNPPEYLHDGDMLETEIERVGVLRNPVKQRTD